MADDRRWPTAPRFAATYDAIADDYAESFGDMLARMPFDRAVLDRFARMMNAGAVVDVGCGPGQIAGYLRSRGLWAVACDLSPRMVRHARGHTRDVLIADLERLPFGAQRLGGLVAFFSIICIPRRLVTEVLTDFHRMLTRKAPMLVSFHVGVGEEHHGEEWRMSFFALSEMADFAEKSGFSVDECVERPPYDFEKQNGHGYLLARA